VAPNRALTGNRGVGQHRHRVVVGHQFRAFGNHRLEHLERPDDPLPALEALGFSHWVNSVREDAEQVIGVLIEASPVILR